MDIMMDRIWSYVLTVAASLTVMYLTMVKNMNVRVTVLEKRLNDLENDINKQDQKLDKLAEILSKMQADIASIKTTLDIRKQS